MTALKWDQVGERFYQTGVDRGVLYLQDGTSVAWNGLTGVDESPNSDSNSYYLDGVKYLEKLAPADFVGKLRAYTYPDEFDSVNGMVDVAPGLTLHEQPPKSFSLCFRTRIGDDLIGTEYGYKLHILYNVMAKPEDLSYNTLQDSNQPIEFGWTLAGTPPPVVGYRPTVHLTINANEAKRSFLRTLEDTLYGSRRNNPTLPTIQEIAQIFGVEGL